jgi:outer membrane protein assembly factor BamB
MNRFQNPSPSFVCSTVIVFLVLFYLSPITFSQIKFDSRLLSLPFKQCWIYNSNKITNLNIASDNEKIIYLSLLNGKILALNSSNGHKIWETEMGGEIISTPILDSFSGNNIYLVIKPFISEDLKVEPNSLLPPSPNNFIVRSISPLTGVTHWQNKLDIGNVNNVYLGIFHEKIIIISESSKLFALNKMDGTIIWSSFFEKGLSSLPLFNNDKIIISNLDNKISIISAETGTIQYQIKAKAEVKAVLFNEGWLIWGDKKGGVYAIDLQEERILWQLRYGAEISNLVLTPMGILVTSFDNFIYLVSREHGKLLWKKRLAARITDLPLIINNFGIVVTSSEVTVNIIDLANGKSINQIFLGSENYLNSHPIVLNNLIAFPTNKGLITVVTSAGSGNCLTN